MNNFDDAFTALIGNEGGYVNNPDDPGGETNWGVTKKVAVANGYTGDMHNLSKAAAKSIAKKAYWDALSLDAMDINVAYQVFDAAYNSGTTQAALWLQRAVGVVADGKVGPVTIKAVNATLWYTVVFAFLAQRTKFYTGLGTWPKFGKGWTNRIAENLSIASKAA